ncbi:hypothetical protein [Paludibacterium sp. THUN1379]
MIQTDKQTARTPRPARQYQPAIRPEQQPLWHTASLLDSDTPPVLLFAAPAIRKSEPRQAGPLPDVANLYKHSHIN